MAAAEARALLDQLMGGDRNAALPKGAALPTKRKNRDGGGNDMLLLPGKRHKSCYDKDVCPLFCAWGVDVYELFVNTKSDIGPNSKIADDSARQEYLNLPEHERDRLGFEYMLFDRLRDLVQQCDRTVTRNQEKLNKELQRQLQKRGGQDYVIDVDDAAVEQLCRNQLVVEELTGELVELLDKLKQVKEKEDVMSKKLSEKAKEEKAKEEEDKVKEEEEEEQEKTDDKNEENGDKPAEDVPVKTEEGQPEEIKEEPTDGSKEEEETQSAPKPPSADSLELGKVMFEKQAILCDVARKLTQLAPLQEAVETQSRNLNHVKSDITTDKTVCETSGNFMSARDADERIAAHYAGKQYVGWKLVRDKFKEMVAKYGRNGPMPPRRGPPMDGPLGSFGGGRGGSGYGGSRPMGGYRGGRGDRRGPPPNDGRWERGGGGRDGGRDRGYGDDRRGGGGRYDQGRRGPDRGGQHYGGSSGNWGRR